MSAGVARAAALGAPAVTERAARAMAANPGVPSGAAVLAVARVIVSATRKTVSGAPGAFAVALTVVALSLAATPVLGPISSVEAAGVTGANFLTLGAGARVDAMGGAGTASASGIEATYWNAASLGKSSGGNLSFSHAAWFADIDYEYVGYVQELEEGLSLALSSSILHTEGIPRTFEDPYGLYVETDGTFSYTAMAISASLGRQIALGFYAGASVKFVYEDNANEGASCMAVDIGGLYHALGTGFTLGIAVRNIGPGLSDGEVVQPLPSQVALAGALALADSALVASADVTSSPDTGVRFSWGLEQSLRNILFLRCGYTISTDKEAHQGLTLGAGALVRGFSVDYSVADYQKLGLVHRFTVGVGRH